MNRVFTASRSRRCSAAACVHGGRVLPGHRIIKVGHRRYLHVADIEAAILAFARASRIAVEAFAAIVPHVVAMSNAVHEFVTENREPLVRAHAQASSDRYLP